MKQLGWNIDRMRLERGWTISEFSHELGVSPRTYHNWLKAEFVPSWGHLKAIASLFGVSLDYLLGRVPA